MSRLRGPWYALAIITEEITLLKYRITENAGKFVAIDSDEEILGEFNTEQEATKVIERAKFEDAIYKHSKILFHASVATVMNEFGVDWQTARYWISTAAEQS